MKRLRQKPDQAWPLPVLFRWLMGLILVLGLAGVFTKLAEDVWFREGFAWDAPLILGVHQLSRPWLDTVMQVVTQTGEGGAIALVLSLVLWFAWQRRWLDAATFSVSAGGAGALNALLKLLFTRPRPALFSPLVIESGYSFPSGHVALSVAVYGLLAVWLWRQRRWGWALLSGAWVLAVAVSRIYLGVHYPSDALGAISFTSLWVLIIFVVRDGYVQHRGPTSG